jgi:pSer/pThr/pTyr-binding forkhead associated (FHA) protein
MAIEASTISRRHARLTLEGDRCLLADLGGTIGTFLNGRT